VIHILRRRGNGVNVANGYKTVVYDTTEVTMLHLASSHRSKSYERALPMKVMAIASTNAALTPDQIQKHLPSEVPATLKLYLEGKVEQFWFREKAGPIFLMNVDSLDQAKAALETLPFVADKLMTYDLMPVTPLMPLGLLIQGK
jgi:hypothetical protein